MGKPQDAGGRRALRRLLSVRMLCSLSESECDSSLPVLKVTIPVTQPCHKGSPAGTQRKLVSPVHRLSSSPSSLRISISPSSKRPLVLDDNSSNAKRARTNHRVHFAAVLTEVFEYESESPLGVADERGEGTQGDALSKEIVQPFQAVPEGGRSSPSGGSRAC